MLCPASEPPMANSDRAALVCANRVMLRSIGEGTRQPIQETMKPAIRPSTMGLRASASRDWRSTTYQRPPCPVLASARASSRGSTNRFSTIMLSPSITPAMGPITSSAMGKATKPLLEQHMPMA